MLFVVFHFNNDMLVADGPSNFSSSSEIEYTVASRQFDDRDIVWMYGAFFVITLCSNLIFAVIPTRDVDSCIEGGQTIQTQSLKEEVCTFRSY